MTEGDPVSRRTVLAGLGSSGLFAIAGCAGGGDGGEDSETPTTTASPTPTRTAPSTPTQSTTDATSTATTTPDVSLPTPTLGPSDADVTVAAYENYLCGHCVRFNLNGFPKIKSEYVDPGSIRYEHHDFPFGDAALYSAVAARSVQATVGNEAFWTYSSELFANAQNTSMELYRSLAADVGADPDVVERHVRELKWKPVVDSDIERGEARGVSGTPTFFVNGTVVDPGGHDSWYDAVSAAIDDALD